jgi:hypothetical protein
VSWVRDIFSAIVLIIVTPVIFAAALVSMLVEGLRIGWRVGNSIIAWAVQERP